MMAMGIERAIHLQTDGREWDAQNTARAIVEAVAAQRAAGRAFDLLLFGNEAADTGDYQVGIRVAHALGLPCITGVKALEIRDGTVVARRESAVGWEILEAPLPAVVTVKEGINLPRYPTVPGRLKAKRAPIETITPEWRENAMEMTRLVLPPEKGKRGEILGHGAAAAPKLVEVLQRLGVLAS
jgi:electron transfer flavoprotein beta subunit